MAGAADVNAGALVFLADVWMRLRKRCLGVDAHNVGYSIKSSRKCTDMNSVPKRIRR